MSKAPLLEDDLQKPWVFIGAHPDDVVITSGYLLSRHPSDSFIIDVSSGAIERDDYYPNEAGFKDAESYALARQKAEVVAAKTLGLNESQIAFLGFPDSKLHTHYQTALSTLIALLADIKPGTIFSHCNEGGHPDHDVTHFLATDLATQLRVQFYEFPSYHMSGGKRIYQRFADFGNPEFQVFPSADELRLKEEAVGSFGYTNILGRFPLRELFRRVILSDIVRIGQLDYSHIGVLRVDPGEVESALRKRNAEGVYS